MPDFCNAVKSMVADSMMLRSDYLLSLIPSFAGTEPASFTFSLFLELLSSARGTVTCIVNQEG